MPRSMSMSTAQPANDDLPPPPPPMDRESFLRRSLTLTSRADRVNLINSLTERISQRMQQNGGYSKVSTHHVIPVNGGGPVAASTPQQPPSGPPAPHIQQHHHHHNNGHVNGNNQSKQLNNRDKIMSPEGEIYGFGAKFKETSQQYFDMSASYPNSNSNGGGASGARKIEEVENQKFIDALSSKLLGKPVKNPGNNPAAGSGGKSTESNKAQLNAEIQRGSFQLRKTNGIQNDRSAPRF